MLFNDTLTELVKTDLANGQVPAMFGKPGTGKSSFVAALAADLGTKCFVLPCNQLADKSDLTGGRLVPTPDGSSYYQVFYPHQVVQDAVEYAHAHPAEQPILFLDEVNRAPADVTSAVLTMITLRRLGREDLPPNLRIVIAGNDQGNVTTLDNASLSRFVVYRVEPSARTLLALLGDRVHPAIKAVLSKHEDTVYQTCVTDADTGDDDSSDIFADETEGLHQITTPRTIWGLNDWLLATPPERVAALMSTPSDTFPGISLLDEVVRAYVGETGFAVLLVAEVASQIASANGAVNQAPVLVRPPEFDEVMAAMSVDELKGVVASFDQAQVEANFAYALQSSKATPNHVAVLAGALGDTAPETKRALVQLALASGLAKQNLQAFFALRPPQVSAGAQVLQTLLQQVS